MNNKNAIASIVTPAFGTKFQGEKVLYGLPCANCRSYFESTLTACPICRCSERVSPQSAISRLTAVL